MGEAPVSLGPRVVAFFQAFLTLSKSHAGLPFDPLEWMRDVLTDLFLLSGDGQYLRLLYLLGVPRKNAKSSIAAGVGMYGERHIPWEVDGSGMMIGWCLVFVCESSFMG